MGAVAVCLAVLLEQFVRQTCTVHLQQVPCKLYVERPGPGRLTCCLVGDGVVTDLLHLLLEDMASTLFVANKVVQNGIDFISPFLLLFSLPEL